MELFGMTKTKSVKIVEELAIASTIALNNVTTRPISSVASAAMRVTWLVIAPLVVVIQTGLARPTHLGVHRHRSAQRTLRRRRLRATRPSIPSMRH